MGDAAQHAVNGPSGAHRWIPCPGAPVLEAQVPDTTSEHAEYGTAAHELAALALEHRAPLGLYEGQRFNVEYQGGFVADEEMIGHVQTYIDTVLGYAEEGELLVEQQLDMSAMVPGCWGTADAVVLGGDGELVVIDLKFGKGVQVEAQGNEQLWLYALGAYLSWELIQDFHTVRTVISQPRLGHLSEEAIPVETLLTWARNEAGPAAERVHGAFEVGAGQVFERGYLQAGDKQCRWCRAKADCPELRAEVGRQVDADFDALDEGELVAPPEAATLGPETMARVLDNAGLIRDWLKAVEERAQAEIEAGVEIPGYKLVQGRAGNRQWDDPEAVEDLIRNKIRLKKEKAYKQKLISPTDAEKMHKQGEIGPRQYQRLQEHVTRSEGKPTIAPVSDKRPAISAGDFDNLDEEQ